MYFILIWIPQEEKETTSWGPNKQQTALHISILVICNIFINSDALSCTFIYGNIVIM